MNIRGQRLLALTISSLFGATACPAIAAPAVRTSAQIEAEIDALLKERDARKIEEAKAALIEEDKANIAAKAAAAKAASARAFLKSVGVAAGPAPAAVAAAPDTGSAIVPSDKGDDSASDGAGAGAAADKDTARLEKKIDKLTQDVLAGSDTAKQKFGGIEFGVGIAFSYDLGSNRRVRDASVVDGIVRVNQSDNVRARLILESHFLFTPDSLFGISNFFGIRNEPGDGTKRWGAGPFVALQPGTDNIIDAIGAGFMMGFRRGDTGTDSFNIGIGVLYDIDSRILGDGILANQPLPGAETEIRYKRREQSGLLIMSSYSF
ncbi:MAG: hypothetical protein ABW128_00100 [Rhizorhabdus sp.]